MIEPYCLFVILTISGVVRESVGIKCNRKAFIDADKLANLLQQLKPNTDMQSVLNILGEYAREAIRSCGWRYTVLDDFEFESGKSFMCGGDGLINRKFSFTSFSSKYLEEVVTGTDTSLPLEFKVTFQNKEWFTIDYEQTYVILPLARDLIDVLKVSMKDISIELTLTTDPLATMIEKLEKQKCILHIKNFEASLIFDEDTLYFPGHQRRYRINQERINPIFRSKVGEIKYSLRLKVMACFYEALDNSGGWVCLNDHVKEVIEKKLTSTRKEISSENFKKRCHN